MHDSPKKTLQKALKVLSALWEVKDIETTYNARDLRECKASLTRKDGFRVKKPEDAPEIDATATLAYMLNSFNITIESPYADSEYTCTRLYSTEEDEDKLLLRMLLDAHVYIGGDYENIQCMNGRLPKEILPQKSVEMAQHLTTFIMSGGTRDFTHILALNVGLGHDTQGLLIECNRTENYEVWVQTTASGQYFFRLYRYMPRAVYKEPSVSGSQYINTVSKHWCVENISPNSLSSMLQDVTNSLAYHIEQNKEEK